MNAILERTRHTLNHLPTAAIILANIHQNKFFLIFSLQVFVKSLQLVHRKANKKETKKILSRNIWEYWIYIAIFELFWCKVR